MKFITNILWTALAKLISIPAIARAIIHRAQKAPYSPILGRTHDRLYMDRWWLFNAYDKTPEGHSTPPRFPWLPSIRVHHICLPDDDDHEHDHPWDARTIILRGWYWEERKTNGLATRFMQPGDTAPILAGQFHRIASISTGGVYTLFFTWKHMEDWGFWVDGAKENWRAYLEKRAVQAKQGEQVNG